MQNIRSLLIAEFWQTERKERIFAPARAYKQILTMDKDLHLIINSSMRASVTMSISTMIKRRR